jgi:hypothetical protein
MPTPTEGAIIAEPLAIPHNRWGFLNEATSEDPLPVALVALVPPNDAIDTSNFDALFDAALATDSQATESPSCSYSTSSAELDQEEEVSQADLQEFYDCEEDSDMDFQGLDVADKNTSGGKEIDATST